MFGMVHTEACRRLIRPAIPVPYTSVSSVQHQYRFRTLGYVRYDMDTGTAGTSTDFHTCRGHLGKFGISIPVPDASVRSIRYEPGTATLWCSPLELWLYASTRKDTHTHPGPTPLQTSTGWYARYTKMPGTQEQPLNLPKSVGWALITLRFIFCELFFNFITVKGAYWTAQRTTQGVRSHRLSSLFRFELKFSCVVNASGCSREIPGMLGPSVARIYMRTQVCTGASTGTGPTSIPVQDSHARSVHQYR